MSDKGIILTSRLMTIASYAHGARLLADVGCDHGRLSVFLIQTETAEHVIASDISPDSLSKAAQLVKKCGLEDRIDIMCSDGLLGLESKMPDTIVIAGMGGEAIAKILEDGRFVAGAAKKLILQPMRGIPELRKYLYYNGYGINDECIVSDAGRQYQIISVTKNAICDDIQGIMPSFPENFFEVGYVMTKKRDPMLVQYLLRMRSNSIKSIKSMQNALADTKELEYRLFCINKILDLFEEEGQ